MSRGHQQSRRRSYGRRQREMRERRPAAWELQDTPFLGLAAVPGPQRDEHDLDLDLVRRFARPALREAIA